MSILFCENDTDCTHDVFYITYTLLRNVMYRNTIYYRNTVLYRNTIHHHNNNTTYYYRNVMYYDIQCIR